MAITVGLTLIELKMAKKTKTVLVPVLPANGTPSTDRRMAKRIQTQEKIANNPKPLIYRLKQVDETKDIKMSVKMTMKKRNELTNDSGCFLSDCSTKTYLE